MELLTKSAAETKRFGKKFASDLINDKRQATSDKKDRAVVLALTGELGSGKTTFVQGLAEGLKIKERIISPTFILMRKHDIKLKTQNSKLKTLYHVDFYRFEKNVEDEVRNLGIQEIWDDPANLVVIEWAEKIKKLIPDNATWIKFKYKGKNKRRILLNG